MVDPLISIVVCTYNRAELLPDCLESLCCQSLAQEKYEIIIVDNNSTDNTRIVADDFVAKYENVSFIFEPQQGLSCARNRGWREACGIYIAFIDDDAKASSDWVEKNLAAFVSIEPKPSAVGGQILPWYEIDPPAWFVDDFEIRTWGEFPGFLHSPEAKFGFSGSNMTFTREALDRLGGFSPEFGMIGKKMRMGEESELFMRLYDSSPLFWYDPEIIVYHWVPIRNTKVLYRFFRAYRGGEAYAQRLERKFFSVCFFKACVALILFLIQSPLFLMKRNGAVKTEFVKKVQELGMRLGSLYAKN